MARQVRGMDFSVMARMEFRREPASAEMYVGEKLKAEITGTS